MPCTGPGGDEESISPQERADFDALTRFACETLGKSNVQCPDYLADWWLRHIELDQRRRREARKQNQLDAVRRRALEKLSTAEKKALDLE